MNKVFLAIAGLVVLVAFSLATYSDVCGNGIGYSVPDKNWEGNPLYCRGVDCCSGFVISHIHDLGANLSGTSRINLTFKPDFAEGCVSQASVYVSSDNQTWTEIYSGRVISHDLDGSPRYPHNWMSYHLQVNYTGQFRWVKVSVPDCYLDWSKVVVDNLGTRKPDLEVKSFQVSGDEEGRPVNISADIANTGNMSAQFLVRFQYDCDGSTGIIKEETENLDPGESEGLETSWIPQVPGNCNLSVYLDPDNDLDEWNETNNYASEVVTIKPLPDFYIGGIEVPSNMRPGVSYKINVTVGNSGHLGGCPDLDVLISRGDILIHQSKDVCVFPHQTVKPYFYFTPPENGTYDLVIKIDQDDKFHEINENNNYFDTQLKVVEINLFSGVIIIPNETSARLAWNTTKPTNATILYWIPGHLKRVAFDSTFSIHHEVTIDGLDPDTEYNVEIWAYDQDGNLSKFSSSFKTLAERSLVDLAITQIVAPDKVYVGENFTIVVNVTNLGVGVSPDFTVYVTDGNNSKYTSIPGMLAGSSVLINFNWTAGSVPVNLTVTVTADPENNVKEYNETNNQMSKIIEVIGNLTNQPPVARFSVNASTGKAPLTIMFNASESYDPDGYIVSYYWDFGDGTNGTGETVTHTYHSTGTYLVTLTVIDDQGLQSNMSYSVTVRSRSHHGGGGGVWRPRVMNLNPPKPRMPRDESVDHIVTYKINGLTITRSYHYSSRDNVTRITTVFEGFDGLRYYNITDCIFELSSRVEVNPTPDYSTDCGYGWIIGLSKGWKFTVEYKVDGHVNSSDVRDMDPPNIDLLIRPPEKAGLRKVGVGNESQNVTVNVSAGSVNASVSVTGNQSNATSFLTGLVTLATRGLEKFVWIFLIALFLVLVYLVMETSGYRISVNIVRTSTSGDQVSDYELGKLYRE